MGIRTALRLVQDATTLERSRDSATGIISPWQTGAPTKIVWSDIFGTKAELITRADAMTIPPVTKGRGIIVSQIAPAPLRAWQDAELVSDQPEWLHHTEGALGPWHRMAWTIDDLLFSGYSLWGVERGDDGKITDAHRIPIEWWKIDPQSGEILVQNSGDGKQEPVDDSSVILFPGPQDGLLSIATRSLRGAASIEESWVKRMRVPIPVTELNQTQDNGLTPEEAEELVQAYIDARMDENGAVVLTPFGVELVAHGTEAVNVATDARNYSKVDVANFLMLPASVLDGSVSTASLTYSTKEGARNEVLDYPLRYWSDPIAARLSQDDVSDEGVSIRFDFTRITTPTASPSGPNTED
ncbi:phage portal protein [Curtobacterium aurantiacum]|uniref:phage portal protein n=1 Tax=Curtobacterium aurantiacum TaxID=3236919 RepID=UPI001BE107DE|nr:phage portal protein [Curtobacterium flaccumfaciens]MBT1676010.1 hypothetical protein [Curtobacterium flaccumfaciens pv. flaccumfaciens]